MRDSVRQIIHFVDGIPHMLEVGRRSWAPIYIAAHIPHKGKQFRPGKVKWRRRCATYTKEFPHALSGMFTEAELRIATAELKRRRML